MRPSAFGMPRISQPASEVVSTVVPTQSLLPASGARPSEAEPPRPAPTTKKRPVTYAPPAVTTDIEELLPITQGVKSLPRPPRLPNFEVNTHVAPAPRRFPWASLSVFGVMLVASFGTLMHYRGERQEPSSGLGVEPGEPADVALAMDLRSRAAEPHQNTRQLEPGAAQGEVVIVVEPASLTLLKPSAPLPSAASSLTRAHEAPQASTQGSAALSAVERIERAFWGQPARVHEALLEEGERALRADDERLAELLFARALDFDNDARGAFGLARVRLTQGDLDGAEGWITLAIRKQPRQAQYRALHSELLQRRGRAAAPALAR